MTTVKNLKYHRDIIRSAFKLQPGCQFYDLTEKEYWTLISEVSDILSVDAATATEVLGDLVDAGNINMNDSWSSSISYTAHRYGLDASTAAKLLSTGVPKLPTDGSLSQRDWLKAVNMVSDSLDVSTREAAKILEINMRENMKNDNTHISLKQWNDAISSVTKEYNVDAAKAAVMLSSNITLSNRMINSNRYKIKCRRV